MVQAVVGVPGAQLVCNNGLGRAVAVVPYGGPGIEVVTFVTSFGSGVEAVCVVSGHEHIPRL